MNNDLLMELSDQGSVPGLLRIVFNHHPNWPKRTPVEQLAADVGITEIRDFKVEGFVGALVTNEEKSEGAILVKEGERPARRRFTIGHELGHFLIPSHRGNRQCTRQDLAERRTDTQYQKQETQANAFSAGLLMPKKTFTRDIDALGSADVSHIIELARAYGTSLEATANRYVELTEDACAIVMSKDGRVRYARPSERFPWLAVKRRDPLPINCATLLSPSSVTRSPSSWSSVDVGVWVETERGRRLPELLEQSLRQANGYCITLLLAEEHETLDEDEDEEHGLRFS